MNLSTRRLQKNSNPTEKSGSLLAHSNGFASIELAIVLLFYAGVVSALLGLAYCSFAKVWINRSAYEALVCASGDASLYECRTQFKMRVKRFLPFGDTLKNKLTRTKKRATIEFMFSISEYLRINEFQQITLPLIERGPLWQEMKKAVF